MPVHLAIGNQIHDASIQGTRLHFTDIVQANIPFKFMPAKRMRKTTSLEVPFQNQDAFLANARQQGSRGKPPIPEPMTMQSYCLLAMIH